MTEQQIDQEAEYAANQRQGRSMPYRYGYKDGYYDGAEAYATRAITAEQENERLRKALERIRIKAKEGIFPDLPIENMGAQMCVEIESIVHHTLTPKPTTNEVHKG